MSLSRFAAFVCAVSIGVLMPKVTFSQDATSGGSIAKVKAKAVTIRGNLNHSRKVFTESRKGRVAFIGGSITEMEGYRPMVMAGLQERFPDTEFESTNAGISSTCSHTGAFRLPRDVISKKPDLLFVEFAVNDDQDAGHSYENALRGMEGVIRAAKSQLPEVDIVITHFVNQSMLTTVQQGDVPTSIRAHETVAKHYEISTCNVAVELAREIQSGQTTWKIYGGVHPKPAGNRIAANLIEAVFDASKPSTDSDLGQPLKTVPLPPPIDAASFSNGRFLPQDNVTLGQGWSNNEPDWKTIPGGFRTRFAGRKLSVANVPGAQAAVKFSGSAVGIFILAGPDAGTVEYSVDGSEWMRADLYHHYSKRLHYPRTVVLQAGLPDGTHQLKLRVSPEKNPASTGHAVRVLEFVAS